MVTEIVDLDLGSNSSFKIVTMEGDIRSRFIEFHLSYNGEVFNLQNKSVKCRYVNGKTTEEVNLVVNDRANGVCTLEIPYRITSIVQNGKCELVISQSGEILSTMPFSVEVTKSLVESAIVESSSEFGALNDALWKIDGFDSRINGLSSQLDNIEIEKVDGIYVREEIAKAQLEGATIDTTNLAYNSDIEMLKSLYENIGNYYDYTKVVSGEYWNNTNKAVKADGYFRTDYIEVKPYRKMVQKIKNELYENYGCILDKDKKLISPIKDVVGLVKLDSETIVYTLPSNAKYIIMSGFGEQEVAKKSFFLLDTLYFSSTTKPVNIENIPVNKLILNPYFDKFMNKKVIFTGDSICYGDGWRTSNTYIPPQNNTGWACLFKEEHPTANVLGYGIGGTCIAKIDGRTDSILERLDSMESDAFRVIFEGGINDCWNNVPLGKLTDTWLFTEEEVTFDEYTFYGALESLIRKSIKKWQGAKIGFIITHYIKTGSGTQGAQVVYMNAIKKVCDKWGIPYYDAFCKIGTNACLSEINTKYFKNGDYTHPLEPFYRDFYGSGIISFVENM